MCFGYIPGTSGNIFSVRTNHSSGCPRQVKTAQGRVKLTHQSSDRTSANFVQKNIINQLFMRLQQQIHTLFRTLNSIPEAAILFLLVHMLSCAWWERSVHFYPRPFWPTGIVIACVCVCVCLSVCQLLLVRMITRHPFKLGSPNLNQKMQNILLKVPIVLGAD